MNKEVKLRNSDDVSRGNSFTMDPELIYSNEAENHRTGVESYGTEEVQKEFRENIKNNGVEEALTIVWRNGVWTLVHGFRRMRAIKQLAAEGHKVEKVPVTQIEDNAEAILLRHLTLNSGLNFTITETAEILLKYSKMIKKENYTEIAKKVNMDAQKVRKLIIFAKKASTPVKDKINSGKLSLSTAEKLVAKYSNQEAQNEALDQASIVAKGGVIRVQHISGISDDEILKDPYLRSKNILMDIITSDAPDGTFKRDEARRALDFLNAAKDVKKSKELLMDIFRNYQTDEETK